MADLFFYGTLCHVPLLERVLGRPAAEIALSPAVLPGWAVFWAAGECFPTIRAEAGGRAEGLLLRDLDEEALVKILTEPKNALVKQYQRLFEMEDVGLTFSDDALSSIATAAVARKTGARGLRSIMENILLDTMYELPGLEGVEEVVISREVADDSAKPLYIYSDRQDDVESSA